MTYKYATQDMNAKCAKAVMLSQSISLKQSVEVAKAIRGRKTQTAITFLEDVIAMRRAVKYTQFNGDVGHKPGVGPARYPIKTAKAFLKLVKLAVANAEDKSLNTKEIKIKSVVVQQGPKSMRHGRQRGRQAKNTHIELVVEEQ